MTRTLGMLALVVLAGCGGQSETGTPIELRLLGKHQDGVSAALLDVKDVTVTAAGRALKVQPGERGLDLTRPDHAWLLGRFRVPDGIEKVQISIGLDDFGGFETADGAGSIDARNSRIRFEAPVAWLTQRGMATVQVDVARSLVARNVEERRFVPRVIVVY